MLLFFFFQAEDGIRDTSVTGVQTCALPISPGSLFTSILAACSLPDIAVAIARTGGNVVWISNLVCDGREASELDAAGHLNARSEERRVGKECRSRWTPDH